MEIIRAACCNCSSSNLQLLQALVQFQVPALNPRFSSSFPAAAARLSHNLSFHTHLPTWVLSSTPNIPRNSLWMPKPLTTTTTTHSFIEDGISDSGTLSSAFEFDPSLAVKKKATEISPELKGTSIFLVGMNSSVKTNLGKLLADALRYIYFDSDSLVEEAAGGRSAAESFKEKDEEGFRDSETEVLKQLSSMGRLVVCAGNGAVQSATNLALLRHGISIWVDVPLDMVAKEVLEDEIQFPVSEKSISGSHSEVLTWLIALYEEMQDGYATADATVSLQKVASQLGYDDYDAATIEDMGLEILKEVEKLMRVKKMMEAAARPF